MKPPKWLHSLSISIIGIVWSWHVALLAGACTAQQKQAALVTLRAADKACEVVELVRKDLTTRAVCLALDGLDDLATELDAAQTAKRDAAVTVVAPAAVTEVVTVPAVAVEPVVMQVKGARMRLLRAKTEANP